MPDTWFEIRQSCTKRLAPWMFLLSLLFLGLIAAELVFSIDVPRFVESVAEENLGSAQDEIEAPLSQEEATYQAAAFRWARWCEIAILVLWPIFWAESLLHFIVRDRRRPFLRQYPYSLAICAFPFLRLCARSHERSDQIWLPYWGWHTADRELFHRLERAFSLPMMWIALLILPVLACQFFFKEVVVEYRALRFALHFSAGLIWFAFAVEFLVMVSVTNKKAKYCAKHWLDLLIILLPLISFLRTLQFVRATKLVKLARLQQLARMMRIYRVRGVAIRGFRAILLLGVVHRLLGTSPEKRIVQLRDMILEKERELDQLRREIAILEPKCSKKNLLADSKSERVSSHDM